MTTCTPGFCTDDQTQNPSFSLSFATRGAYHLTLPHGTTGTDALHAHPVSAMPPANALYFGDNLDVLQKYVKDETVDLVYLDPPFNSNQNYNVLFRERGGARSSAQVAAFEDTWTWDEAAALSYQETVERGGRLGEALAAFRTLVGPSDMLAYLSMMAPRLRELHRVLKPTGSLYLHCDPTASHYLKLLLDAVFGPEQFRNEIVWRRTGAHGKVARFAPVHDTIFYFCKDRSKLTWNGCTRPHMLKHVENSFVKSGDEWTTNYSGNVLTGSGTRGGESGSVWRGFDPTAKGRHWAIPGGLIEGMEAEFEGLGTLAKLDKLLEKGLVRIEPGQAWPTYQRKLRPSDGAPAHDIWAYQPHTEGTVFGTSEGIDSDVRWLSPQDAERLGYPTQKPVALLERIISASSNPGDVVLDPFCGCGTAIDAAQGLGRRWIGIDVTQVAIGIIRHRIEGRFGLKCGADYQLIGEPTNMLEAAELAKHDRFQFQTWIVNKLAGRPVEAKKGKDRGIDGKIQFHDELEAGGPTKTVVISVKSGTVGVRDVRDLRGVLEREQAQIAVLVTLEDNTKDMRTEAAAAGNYRSPLYGERKFQRLQLLTVDQIVSDGKRIDMPGLAPRTTLPPVRAPKKKRGKPTAGTLFEE